MLLIKTTIRLVALALLISAGFSCGSGGKPSEFHAAGGNYTRIVSLAPNITETLFALGLGDRVAGVTRFCTYPPEAENRPRVGGFLDINFEALAALRPDLVILLPEHDEIRKKLEGLQIKTMTVHNRIVRDIFSTIRAIGDTCGVSARADSLARDMETRMESVRKRTESLPKPRVLVIIERKVGGGTPGAVYVAGPHTSFDEMIRLAGGFNAYRGPEITYPEISVEGIIRLNPEVILDIIPTLGELGFTEERAREDWKSLRTVSAVKTNRIFILCDNALVIPGPRFIEGLEKIAGIIHGPDDGH
jgi:iron complex transport system substrate-binding protein